MASEQPQRSNVKSELKFMAQTAYTTMFVWTVLKLFFIFLEEERRKNPLTSTRPVGFAVGKNTTIDHTCLVSPYMMLMHRPVAGRRAALLRDVFAAERGGADVRDRSADAEAVDGQGRAALLLAVARVPGTLFN